MAVDPQGSIYVTMIQGAAPGNAVLKIDWNQPGTWIYYGDDSDDPHPLNEPWDVIVKPPYVYIANSNTADWPEGNSMVQLTRDLTFVKGYGLPWTGVDPLVGEFYGPRRFLAPLNAGFILADEEAGARGIDNLDRLVFIKDLEGSGWKTYGVTGSADGEFRLLQEAAF
jgi:hypothetical protein